MDLLRSTKAYTGKLHMLVPTLDLFIAKLMFLLLPPPKREEQQASQNVIFLENYPSSWIR